MTLSATACRFITISNEGFKSFEVTPEGGEGSSCGDVAWVDVQGASRAGEWNGCVTILDAACDTMVRDMLRQAARR
jgi:hypothetical protein